MITFLSVCVAVLLIWVVFLTIGVRVCNEDIEDINDDVKDTNRHIRELYNYANVTQKGLVKGFNRSSIVDGIVCERNKRLETKLDLIAQHLKIKFELEPAKEAKLVLKK